MHWSPWAGKAPTQQKFRQSRQQSSSSQKTRALWSALGPQAPALNSGSYEFYGEGEVYTCNEDAVERYDTSSLNGGLQVAVRVLEELIGVDQNESVRKIVERLHKDLSG